MIAGSLNRLARKGRTASIESGPPRFINTTATRVMSCDGVQFGEQAGEHRDVLRRCFRQYAVAQVEYERSPAECPAQLPDRGLESRTPDDQQHRVKIPLNRDELLQPRPGVAGGHHCIEANTVDPGLRDIPLVEQTGASWKADDRAIGKPVLQCRNDAPCRFDHPALESGFGEDTRPTVEELDDLGAGF